MGEPSGRLRLSVIRIVPSLSWARSRGGEDGDNAGRRERGLGGDAADAACACGERTTTI